MLVTCSETRVLCFVLLQHVLRQTMSGQVPQFISKTADDMQIVVDRCQMFAVQREHLNTQTAQATLPTVDLG